MLSDTSPRHDSVRDDPRMSELEKEIGPLPEKLQRELTELERIFEVDTRKLKEICDRFEEELYLGLARMSRCLLPSAEDDDESGSLPMNVTWIQSWPTGHERGEYVTLDLGGTYLRVCWIILSENHGDATVDQENFDLPEEYKVGDAEQLYSFLMDSIEAFLHSRKILDSLEPGQQIPLGFTFSFPITQEEIDHGVLQTWTKGYDVKGVEGHNVAQQLREALQRRRLPLNLVALINDTTGAMLASAYRDPEVIIGAIFGPGCNAAYFEDCRSIPKISGFPLNQPMAINCEYGAFDNEHLVLPRTKYDIQLDENSPRPGEQAFEKMSAGRYLGEIFRLAILDLTANGLLFKGQSTETLETPYILDTALLSALENDDSPRMQNSLKLFNDRVNLQPSPAELLVFRRLAEAISIRGARLSCCGIAAICRKKDIKSGHVAADESVADAHPNFKKRWTQALGEVLDWSPNEKNHPIVMTAADDGSSIGAAVISAMALQWQQREERYDHTSEEFDDLR